MDQTIVVQYSLIASALIAAVAAFAAAFGDSKLASHVIDGMTRQPEIQGQLFTSMLVGIGLIESIPIIAIVGRIKWYAADFNPQLYHSRCRFGTFLL